MNECTTFFTTVAKHQGGHRIKKLESSLYIYIGMDTKIFTIMAKQEGGDQSKKLEMPMNRCIFFL